MQIQITGLLASNAPTNDNDVRQAKKALNKLGYYVPYNQIGITGLPDTALFTALKKFQKDNGFPVSGEIRLDDQTLNALNKALSSRADDGFYVWRSVEDDRVRNTHAQYNRTVRPWRASPDPGDDFNCRCWAEPITVPEDVQEALMDIYKSLAGFRERKLALSTKLLEHYLSNTGEKITLPEETFDNSSIVRDALAKNRKRFEDQVQSLAEKLLPPNTFNDYWDVDVKKERSLGIIDPDFSQAIGSAKIRSQADFTFKKSKDSIEIHGKVVHQIKDLYDFNKDRAFDYLAFKNERLLAQKGYAKAFDVEWKKEQNFEGEVIFKNGKFQSRKINWEE